ncbi:hypothetical protein UVI_02054120 [Ustilaginoidea virens]|uniref:SWI/SNF family DNA-dependent ATPase Ris1 n=1 Tax=Ustilaginoidea virens TaxID=1159556 RepID=A0A1B5KYJ5_USTVR|nr:hypothetical protein UVI_02054120 [Ustilaginoidea virens]
MPGSYDPSWDDADQWRSAESALDSPSNPRHGSHDVHSRMAMYSPGSAPQSSGSRPGAPQINDKFVLRSQPLFAAHSHSPQRASSAVLPSSVVPILRSSGGDTLSHIIDRTSAYDFSNGVDQNGVALQDRLMDIFSHEEQDPQLTEKELDDLLRNIRPDVDIPAENREIGPAGLKYPLYRHQGVALAWMKEMERGTNKGGILADDMGLGKTISTLALILANPGYCRPKTNLIIGPLSLIRQWEDEIKKKTKVTHRLSVFVYHNKKATTDELLKYDVVLTTYGTIAQELKRYEKFIEENNDRNIDFKDRSVASRFPLLHPEKAVFHRIILDEAQCIKNRNTRTAKACHQLKATYRWCLTGTPMMNGVLELYSLLRFLRIKPYHTWEAFRKVSDAKIGYTAGKLTLLAKQGFGVLFGMRGDPKSMAMSRLRALLKAVMLRRKKDSELDGKPILQLPPKTEHVVYAELSTDERDFYKQLEEKAQVMFNKYLREGTVSKNYSSILVLLLRLRQACCHPHLNLDVNDSVSAVSHEDIEKLVKELDRGIVERIKGIKAFECPICYDAVQSPSFFIPCGHDSCKDCLLRITADAAVQNIHEGNESDRAKCPVCRCVFEPKKCFTYDTFKTIHMAEEVEKMAADGDYTDDEDHEDEDDSDDGSATDDDDSDVDNDETDEKGNLKGFVVDDGVDEDEGDMDHQDYELADVGELARKASKGETNDANKSHKTRSKKKAKKSSKGKGKAKETERQNDVKPSMLKALRMEAVKNRVAYRKYMRYLRKTWMPAAKVTECMHLLKKIRETGEKTIIFSQWTLLLDLLQVAMWHEGFDANPLRYDGSMTGDQRSFNAQQFRDDAKQTVMLVSLRAGNAGLNLTAATRVIIMDPFWNPYIEMQAIDRTYRIGQQKEVEVYRILTKETVEDRIVHLQDKKKQIVEAALDEKESMRIGRLSEHELRYLFNAG